MLAQLIEPSSWLKIAFSLTSSVAYAALACVSVKNEYREVVEKKASLSSDQIREKRFEFRHGLYSRIHAELHSPGLVWGMMSGVSLLNAGEAFFSGRYGDCAMFSACGMGQASSAHIINKGFKYWERFHAFRSGKSIDEIAITSPLDPLLARPGLPWCGGDTYVGVKHLNLAHITASISASSILTLSGIALGAAGMICALLPDRVAKKSFMALGVFSMYLSCAQNTVFAFVNLYQLSPMTITLAGWAVSAGLLAVQMQANLQEAKKTT
jgi:hypothetical protein